MEFEDDEEKEKYLTLCEELFALAEEFNRQGYIEEALELKNSFKKFENKLTKDQREELIEVLNSRGL